MGSELKGRKFRRQPRGGNRIRTQSASKEFYESKQSSLEKKLKNKRPATSTFRRQHSSPNILSSSTPDSRSSSSVLRIGRSFSLNLTIQCKVAFVLLVSGLCGLLISLASPYWMHVTNYLGSSHSGLWRVCILNKCDALRKHKTYECSDYNADHICFLDTGWFRSVQAGMLLSLLAHVAALVLLIIETAAQKATRRKRLLTFTALTACAVAGLHTFVAVVLYGVNQGQNPASLSWGYVVAMICCIIQVASTAPLILEFNRLGKGKTSVLTLRPSTSDEELSMQLLAQPERIHEEKTVVRRRNSYAGVEMTSQQNVELLPPHEHSTIP